MAASRCKAWHKNGGHTQESSDVQQKTPRVQKRLPRQISLLGRACGSIYVAHEHGYKQTRNPRPAAATTFTQQFIAGMPECFVDKCPVSFLSWELMLRDEVRFRHLFRVQCRFWHNGNIGKVLKSVFKIYTGIQYGDISTEELVEKYLGLLKILMTPPSRPRLEFVPPCEQRRFRNGMRRH